MASETFVENANRENRYIPITLLTITHDSLSTPIYCTLNGEDVVSNGVTYKSVPFTFTPPKITRDGIQPGKMSIENISGDVVEACRTIAGNAAPAKCTFSFVMPTDWDTVERTWPSLELRNVQYTDNLTGTLCHPMFGNEPHTKYTASDSNFPGL